MKTKGIYWLVPVLVLLFTPILGAEQRVLGSNLGVEFLTIPKYDSNGHKYGNDFYATNRNMYSMNITIMLTGGFNVLDNLRRGWVKLPPNSQVYLGSITQADNTQEWQWNVEWRVRQY